MYGLVHPYIGVAKHRNSDVWLVHVCHGKVLMWMLDFVEDFLGGIRLHQKHV